MAAIPRKWRKPEPPRLCVKPRNINSKLKKCNNESDKVWKNKINLKEQKTSSSLADTEEKPKLKGTYWWFKDVVLYDLLCLSYKRDLIFIKMEPVSLRSSHVACTLFKQIESHTNFLRDHGLPPRDAWLALGLLTQPFLR